MLTHTPLQSAFDDPTELFSRTNTANSSGLVGAAGNAKFDELLTENMIQSETPVKPPDINSEVLKSPSPATEGVPSNNDAENQKSGYLGGFNAVSGLLVRFWKKKELIEIRKSSEGEKEINSSNPENQPDNELAELLRKRKEQSSDNEIKTPVSIENSEV